MCVCVYIYIYIHDYISLSLYTHIYIYIHIHNIISLSLSLSETPPRQKEATTFRPGTPHGVDSCCGARIGRSPSVSRERGSGERAILIPQTVRARLPIWRNVGGAGHHGRAG